MNTSILSTRNLGLALAALLLPATAQSASVGPSGYTNDFSIQPAVGDWSTLSIAGATANVTTPEQLDAAVQAVAANTVNTAVAVDAVNPPALNASAVWCSSGFFLQTRPTGNNASALMCTLVNSLGANASSIVVSYDFAKVAAAAEEVEGHRVYYSLSGAAGSWTLIPSLTSVLPGRVSANISLVWPNGANLYLLWADENGSPSPDTACQIDNFSATAVSAAQVPASIVSSPLNQTVDELKPVTLTVVVAGNPAPTLQWYRNGLPIANATNTTHEIAAAPLSDHNADFFAVAANTVSNVLYSATSGVARLTVNADLVAPVLLSAATAGQGQILLTFSEKLAASGALTSGNYGVTGPGGIVVSNAVLDSSETNVLLTVTPLTGGASYTVTVNNVRDQSAAANQIANNSQASFTAASFVAANIGNPAQAGSATVVGGGYDLTGGGTNIAGAMDQFFFYYQPVAGAFDYRVRVDGMTLADVWAKAGLMARETLTTNSRFAMVAATPSFAGIHFLSRTVVSSNAVPAGQFPVNYPQTWLRLTRSGDVFTGYGSIDGQSWVMLGSATMTSAATSFYLGLATCGATTNGVGTVAARFRELSTTGGGTVVPSISLTSEPLGPASRSTGLIISEIMYHPKFSNDLEFIEIFNAGLVQENLTGHRLSGDIGFSFPSNTVLPAGGFLVVARNPALLQQAHGINGVMGPWDGAETNALPDSSGRVRLRNPADAVMLEVNYLGGAPWPISADGAGHSLVLARPSYGQDDPRAWAASDRIGGSPGRMETTWPEPLRNVVVNEFLANSDAPAEDFIELFNHSTQPVDISGAYLSDDRDTNKFRIPAGTTLPARGFRSFTETELGFGLSSTGERIYLVNSNQDRVIDLVAFNGQAPGVSAGRYPDGGEGIHELVTQTAGTNNSPLLIRPIVINEIMFNPPSGDSDDEFVELFNRGTNAVDISNWRFSDGIDFSFAPNTIIPTNGYLVVARKLSRMLTNYVQLNGANTVGDFGGTLANGGERLALSMPEYLVTTNGQGHPVTNINWIVVDEVRYRDSGRWARWADGGGSSLELIDPNSDNRLVANWADSDETAKAPWTNVTFTGVLDNAYARDANGALLNEIQVLLLGAGEALMDDLNVQSGTGPNVVGNPNFNTGSTGWTIQGNHVRSTLEPVGPNNPSQCLHLRATSGGDNGANRVECDLTTTLSAGTTATIGGRFRWQRGFPIVLLRLHGGAIEAVGTLPLPPNLGTPGLPNSRLAGNAGPAIYDVAHSPVLPAATQPVVVTARVSDPDGIASVQLQYRIDPSASLSAVTMRDDGTAGDAVAGDGVFSGTIPGQASGALVAFRISTTDSRVPAGARLFPPDAPTRECLVRFGEPAVFGNLGVYRFWMTAANMNTWTGRERLSNEPLDGTFVYGNLRVVYNSGARYRGSPFTRNYSSPVGVGVGATYVWTMPDDDTVFGSDEFNLDALEPAGSGNVRDATALREVTSFKMADQLGLDFSYQRYVHIVINGITSTSRNIPIYSDTQQPNNEYVTMWYPDNDAGELFKIDDWFEFADFLVWGDGTGMQGNKCANLGNWTTTSPAGPVKKQARYRWNWEKKFNKGLNDDYTSLYAADNALNAPDATLISAVNNAIDVENWMTVIAFGHVIGDWDRYGYRRGKNTFTYKPTGERFRMLLWDLDFSLGCTSGDGPTQDLFQVSQDGETGQNHMPEVSRLLNTPHFRRIYLQALLRIADGPLQDPAYAPILDARFRALQANNVVTTSPYVGSGAQSISIPAWIQQRRANIYSTISAQTNLSFAVTSSNNLSLSSNVMTLAGRAPLKVKSIRVNGLDYAVTWTSVTEWSIRVPLVAGANTLAVQPYDRDGVLLSSSVVNVTATYTNAMPDPAGLVVFNELMFDPAVPGTEYVELFNSSSNVSFDLSGWRINGLDYSFPVGSVIGPRAFLLLVKDSHLCLATYGAAIPIFDQYSGNLQPGGETLTLSRPGAAPGEEIVVDRVRYEAAAPWSTAASGTGASLQLRDATQDNSRVANWSDGAGWRYFSISGIPSGSFNKRLMLWLDTAGKMNIDDMFLALGPVAESGSNYISNSDFELPLKGYWKTVGIYATNSTTSASVAHGGGASMELVFTNTGGSSQYLYYDLTNLVVTNFVTTTNYTLSFWYLPTTNASRLTVRLGTGIFSTFSVRPSNSSPATTNSVAQAVTPFPSLWLNEVQPVNLNGVTDGTGTREPFIEIYNSGPDVVPLDGMYLSDNYTNLGQWAFPAGATLNPGEFKVVFADGEPAQTTAAEWHANFRLDAASTQVVLSRTAAAIELLDYLNFAGLRTNWSYGDFPDGQPFFRSALYYVTPGGTNDGREAPITVSINEWMAANASTIADPADGDFDDWFELYNPGTNAANLEGYYLTDNLTNKTQFKIPAGYVIPPGGRLLVWADGETGQNSTNRADLHVNFQLNRNGEAIGLFDADGTAIDTISFGIATDDVSMGRCPDGSASIAVQPMPTPRTANTCGGGNSAPILNPIGNRTVHVGQVVSFTAAATDAEAPPQTLSFSLVGAPAGASIHSTSGAFTWNTAGADAPSTNVLTVLVTDSAAPPLDDSESISIVVLPPPGFGVVTRNGPEMNWSWNTIPGVRYQLLYKPDLLAPGWTPLGGVQTGTGAPLTVTIDTSTGPSGFYQISVVN